MNPYKFLIALALTFTGLVAAYGGGSPPVDNALLAVPQYNTVDILSPEQQIARIDALNASTAPSLPETTVAVVDAFASYKCGVWFPLAISQGWPDNPIILKTLDRIMWRESRCTPDADSGPDHGLMQINQIHSKWIDQLGWTFEDMKDPAANLRFAWLLYSGREANNQCGWTPWAIKC
jgi:soluble lytic murein transglycosylase-like protein